MVYRDMAVKGSIAPDFELPDQDGKPFRLHENKGRIIVLYFYPRALTPGCTREAMRFNELYEEFAERNAVIVGVSTDPVNKVKRFHEKLGLKFRLLSDPEAKVVDLYGVRKKKAKKPSAERTTFIIDPELRIVEVLRNIRPAEKHADKALEIVKKLAT